MYLNLCTEYSFRSVFSHTEKVISHCKSHGASFAGIADKSNSFGHVTWQSQCIDQEIKPIFGVRIPVFYTMDRIRRIGHNEMTFIALNLDGLREIYSLINTAYKNFYYMPRISSSDVNCLSNNIIILSGLSPNFHLLQHDNIYLQLAPNTPNAIKSIESVKAIACCDNSYISPKDRKTYEVFADARLRDNKTSIQHIPTYDEFLYIYPKRQNAIDNLLKIAEKINFTIEKSPMVTAKNSSDIIDLCKKGAKQKQINITKGKYSKRFNREIKLIKEKKYTDYFLIVSDLVSFAKTKMVVGPARGSAAGSLVCFLLGITEVDPIKYNLYFERFIDINRHDLPDIDIDFQDNKRNLIINYLKKKYGDENIAQIGNINRLKVKSSIIRFAKALKINLGDVEELKESVSDGTLEKSLIETQAGKEFIEQHPNMKNVHMIENHASHASVHAAGVLVSTNPITHYCGINSRETNRVAMIDKVDAEKINLLKIDALGLRTLTIISSVCDQIGKPYDWIYKIPLNDKKTYKLFNRHRFSGIFQFEGDSITGLAKKIKIENIEDISILNALCRPGALLSGGANRYIKRRNGKSKIEYLDPSKKFINATKTTLGIIVFQEQVMEIAKKYAGLSWAEVSALRKAVSKSKGLDKFEKLFLKSAKKKGHENQNIKAVWEDIKVHGSYSFNISHSISYSVISYLTAYLKAHYPFEFTVATLNHTKDDNSAIKFLRDMVENEGIKYVAYDKEYSMQKWVTKEGKIYGGVLSINGIGPAAANKIIKHRREGLPNPPGIQKHLDVFDSPFRYLYPARQVYGSYYKKGRFEQPCREIKKIKGKAKWIFIGRLIKKNVRDLNEPALISKRNGERREGDTTFLQLVIEDDTGSILCSIWGEDYEYMGKEIAENGNVDKDWYLIKGNIASNQFRAINIEAIKRITK